MPAWGLSCGGSARVAAPTRQGSVRRIAFTLPRCVLLAPLAIAAWFSSSSVQASSDLTFGKLSAKDGLQDDYVSAILQDHRGYIWFGTQAGLSRCDGSRVHNFTGDASDPTRLGSVFV